MAKTKKQEIIERAEVDLEFFIRLVHPNRVLGTIHTDLISWWNRQGAKSHQLVLLPRDHQKSAMVAYRVAWEITKNPAIRILYISATSNLAKKQLKFIKDILTSDIYLFYWPEMVNKDESKREKWTDSEIAVDHPTRSKELVRDPTIFTAGLTTTIVGMHCDIAVLDDVVIDDNAYDDAGRQTVRTQVSYLASIGGTDSKVWAVGTRYHPKDLYHDFQNMVVTIYDDEGVPTDSYNLYEIYEKPVEDRGDGTGQYLWPKTQRKDGKWFGFDQRILAQKRAQYFDVGRFRSQYYNDPSTTEDSKIKPEHFQYYDKSNLEVFNGFWHFKGMRLNVFAAMDFAYSTSKDADYTAIVVIGIDAKNNYYVLDIERFKTDNIKTYFDKLLTLHQKWDFRKLRAEITAAQSVIVKDLKENYLRPYGLALSIDEHRPTRNKEERVLATLQGRYSNLQMWHYKGGNCSLLEEELTQSRPAHDDIKDCLAAAVDLAVAPTGIIRLKDTTTKAPIYHTRFGGLG